MRGIVASMASNLQQISTWRGNAKITVHSISGSGEDRQMGIEASFLYDAESGAERSLKTTYKSIYTKDGKETSLPAVFNNGVVVNDTYVHMQEPVVRTSKAPRQLVILPKAKVSPQIRSGHFSAMWYMRSAGTDILTKMQMLLDTADTERQHKDRYFQVSKAGNLVTLEYMYEGKLQNRWVFDLDQGSNMVEYWADEGVIMARYRYKYASQGGAWVPATLDYSYENRNPRAPLRTESRHIEWTNQVNGPIDPKEFEWEALGVKPGDLVSDTLAGVSYTYQAEQAALSDAAMQDIDSLVVSAATQVADPDKGPATSPVTQPAAAAPGPVADVPVPSSPSGLPRLVVGLVVVAAVALALVAWHMGRARRERR